MCGGGQTYKNLSGARGKNSLKSQVCSQRSLESSRAPRAEWGSHISDMAATLAFCLMLTAAARVYASPAITVVPAPNLALEAPKYFVASKLKDSVPEASTWLEGSHNTEFFAPSNTHSGSSLHGDSYSFSYGVDDPHTGDHKSHSERREPGGVVTGHYSLMDPDGIMRVVHYRADPVTGFHATVSRPGHSIHPQQSIPSSLFKRPIVVKPLRSSFTPVVGPSPFLSAPSPQQHHWVDDNDVLDLHQYYKELWNDVPTLQSSRAHKFGTQDSWWNKGNTGTVPLVRERVDQTPRGSFSHGYGIHHDLNSAYTYGHPHY